MSSTNKSTFYNSNIETPFGEFLNTRLQNFDDFPNAAGVAPGWEIWHTGLKSSFTWDGAAWKNTGQIYQHPASQLAQNPFANEINSGVTVLQQLVFDNLGHPIKIGARNLTNADLVALFIDDAVKSGNFTYSSNKIEAFVEARIDQKITGALIRQAISYTPATVEGNVIPPVPVTAPTIKKDMCWTVTAKGWFGSQKVDPQDMIIANVDNAGSTEANYSIVDGNAEPIFQATELVKGIMQLATDAEALAGSNAEDAITPKTLKVVFDAKIGGYTSNFGDGVNDNFTFTHPCKSKNLLVSIYRNADDKLINCSIKTPTIDTIRIDVLKPLSVNEYRLTLMARNY